MDERAVDSCCFVEDLQGPSSNLVICVAKADVNSDGSVKLQHTLDPAGVPMCRACGFRVTLHRRKPDAPVVYVPPPPPRTLRSVLDVQVCAGLLGVAVSDAEALEFLTLKPQYLGAEVNRDIARIVVNACQQLRQRAHTSTRFSFSHITFIALNGPFDDMDHPKLVTGMNTRGAPVVVKFVDRSSPDVEQRLSVEMELRVCKMSGDCPHLVPCDPKDARAAVQDRQGVQIAHSEKIGIIMPHYPVTAARCPPLKHSLLATKLQSIVGALHFLHKNQIVHMDVKPSNIFIDHDGEWRLGDFDACCTVGEHVRGTTTGFHLSTTDLHTATFGHDWGMLLCTIAVLMTRRSGGPVDSPVRIEWDLSHGSRSGHMVPRARDDILNGATDELREAIATVRCYESEGV